MTTRTTSPDEAFANAYNDSADLRAAVNQALIHVGAGLEEYEDAVDWAECLASLEDMIPGGVSVEVVQGIPGNEAVLYPLAAYGWDGGSPINSEQINLTDLVSSSIQGGPYATIVKRTDTAHPGLAIHYIPNDRLLTIQLF